MIRTVIITPIHRLGVHFAHMKNLTVIDTEIVTYEQKLRGRDLSKVTVYFILDGWEHRSISRSLMWDMAVTRGAEPIEVRL